jgi:hypothetical protein
MIPDAIVDEFSRLGVSADQVLYSGLMADYQSLLVDGESEVVTVKIYDDYADGIYDGEKVLNTLKTLEFASVHPEASNNVWDLIGEFEL